MIKNLFKLSFKNSIIYIVIMLTAFSIISSVRNNSNNNILEVVKDVKVVETYQIGENLNTNELKTVGSVNPESKIDITATTRGTVKGIYFNTGDKVSLNKLLVTLFDSATFSNLNNAQTNLSNTKNNYEGTLRITEETIRQAEINVESALKSIVSAEISIKSAEDNLENTKSLRTKSQADTKNSAIISFANNLNTVFNTLDQINYIIQADNNGIQLDGINKVLGVKNTMSVSYAKNSYWNTKNAYDKIKNVISTEESVLSDTKNISEALRLSTVMIDDTIKVLDYTITSSDFSETALNMQKSSLTALRSSISGAQLSSKNILNNLENLDLIYNQEIDALENGLASAKNQLELAKTNHSNALASLENAKNSKKQQLNGAQTTIDNASGQLSLAQIQTGELNIKTPISGIVTGKFIEIGAEVNPGQKIAQISQTNLLKINVDLSSEEIYRIDKDKEVTIGSNLIGKINNIDPSADPITKKVGVEILFDNSNNDLIAGTFIDVIIPLKELEKSSENSFFVPLKAIIITQTDKYVYVIEDSRAIKKIIKTGGTEGSLIEILEGVEGNEEIIIEGNKNLEDGDLLEVRGLR